MFYYDLWKLELVYTIKAILYLGSKNSLNYYFMMQILLTT